jgi:hypothetical protein
MENLNNIILKHVNNELKDWIIPNVKFNVSKGVKYVSIPIIYNHNIDFDITVHIIYNVSKNKYCRFEYLFNNKIIIVKLDNDYNKNS